jgi:hypothetical protein
MSINSLLDNYIELNLIEVAKIQLLKEYRNYKDVFLEKNILKLPNFIYIKYTISIKKDKKIRFYSQQANSSRRRITR